MNTILFLLVIGTLLFFFYGTGSTLLRRTGFRLRAYPGAVGALIGGTIGLAFAVCSVGSGWGPVIGLAAVLEVVPVGLVVGAILEGLVRLVVALTRNDSS
jgi:hypothetical protein